MAAKHILSLEIPTVSDCNIFTIKDTSQYAEDLTVSCPELLVTSPGFNRPQLIEVPKGFTLNLNACALGIQTTGCDDQPGVIPDGIYVVRYRVKPHDKAYVEYNFLRVTTLLSTYHDKLCELDIKPCEPTSQFKQTLADMHYIRTMIDAAKAKVEYAHSPNEGMELYEFAKKKLKKITCDVCCK
jgi:hypothetical protein